MAIKSQYSNFYNDINLQIDDNNLFGDLAKMCQRRFATLWLSPK